MSNIDIRMDVDEKPIYEFLNRDYNYRMKIQDNNVSFISNNNTYYIVFLNYYDNDLITHAVRSKNSRFCISIRKKYKSEYIYYLRSVERTSILLNYVRNNYDYEEIMNYINKNKDSIENNYNLSIEFINECGKENRHVADSAYILDNNITLENFDMYVSCMKNPSIDTNEYYGDYFYEYLNNNGLNIEDIKSGDYGSIEYEDYAWDKCTGPKIEYEGFYTN